MYLAVAAGCLSVNNPTVFPAAAPLARATAALPYRLAPESPALDPWQVHKWNTHFNGKSDPAAFLETTFYFPVNYLEDLEADISRRLQKPDEPATIYLTDLQTLVRRHGDLNPEQELGWLYRNLLPDYRQYIRRNDFTDVLSLSAKIKEFELLRQEVRQVYDGKEPIPRRNTIRRFENRSSEQYSVPPRQAESRPVVERSVPMPRNTRLPATPREEPPNIARQQDTPTAPQTAPRTYRSPELSENRQSTTAAAYDRNICWRCGRDRTFPQSVSFPAQETVSRKLHIAADDVTIPAAQLANGRLATVTRAYRIDFLIGEDSFSECLFHLRNLSSDLVLGMDILSQYSFEINPSAGTVLLNDRPISKPLAAPSSPLGGISLTLSQPEEEQLARFLATELPSFQNIQGTTHLEVYGEGYLRPPGIKNPTCLAGKSS
ncbi:hypothetical protein NQ314_020510 [Rhamnusium bicolor]|uniref:Retrotransposon gag domain-containing protein n=1 Tax=Rhamnusium bicolor TaxID=1586634 RepID=A0AAV8WKS1_9CUCU|nr:hypothetical protein NQ314_020510 [Rhamnusium bicolor]